MNVKEAAELISYLKNRKELAFVMQKEYEDLLDNDPGDMREAYEKSRSEYGQEVTWLIYMIRLLEGLEVAR